ncbi:MAG TPA: WYL domain-containing protein [Allosphingosinicella sp.]|jgi:hypothetical protein
MNSDNARGGENLRWGVRRRLEFIDFRLMWDARLNRSDLCDHFRISPQQASLDLASYERLAPANMLYDRGQRAFLRAPSYAPLLIAGLSDRYLLQLQALRLDLLPISETWFDRPPPAEVARMRHRRVDDLRLQQILDAIRHGLELRVTYSTMSGKPAGERHIVPHALANGSNRWHARCWCRENGEFRDFNLNRIREVHELLPGDIDAKLDLEWHNEVELVMKPNPELAEEVQDSIRLEYDFEGPELVVTSRIALVFYLFHEYNLEVASRGLKAAKRQLVLVNDEEVEHARTAARDMAARGIRAAAKRASA